MFYVAKKRLMIGHVTCAFYLAGLGLALMALAPQAPAAESGDKDVMMNKKSYETGDRDGWFFYSGEDRVRIRKAAKTEWGQLIVEELKATVAERLTHDLDVPTTPAGHYHHYFCPEHKCLLEFDWDKPRQHYCPQCKKYLTGERYDYPWIRFVHRYNQSYLSACMMLHIATGEQQYADHIRAMLLDYAQKYPDLPIHGNNMEPDAGYGGKIFSQTLCSSSWVVEVAPAYVEIRSLLSPAEREKIETGLFRPCADVIFRNRAGGNWQVWHNGGLASCAVALGDEALMEIALNAPKHGYKHMMKVGATKDGWWDEGSPCYHFFPLDAMVYTAEAARCRGINLWDARLKALFDGPLRDVYPDLSFPAHNDGWYGVSLAANASLYEVAALRLDEPLFDELLARCYSQVKRTSFRALAHGKAIEPDASPMPLKSTIYDDLGVALLRDGRRTVVFKFGPHGGGHGHPDKLSLAIHDGTREILSDMGTPGYGVPDYTRWYRKTVAHNTVIVDQADQKAAKGELVTFEPAEDGGSVEAGCATAYEGVSMKRRLTLAGGVLSDRFACQSQDEHTYDYVLLMKEPIELGSEATPIDFSGISGYERITQARQWTMAGPVTLALDGVALTLDAGGAEAIIIQGEAPGVPFNASMVVGRDSAFESCYPLIIRVKGKAMAIDATWKWVE